MDNTEKLGQVFANAFATLSRKLDSIFNEVKRPPIINIAPPEVKITVPELKLPEFPAWPEIKLPDYPPFPPFSDIKLPDFPAPVVNVPAPVVNVAAPVVNVPPANITVAPTPVEFPKEMVVRGMDELVKAAQAVPPEQPSVFKDVSSKTPLSVMVIGKDGKQVSDFGGEFTAPSMVAIRVGTEAVSATNLFPVTTEGFAIPVFDTEVVDETLAPATTVITYKKNGATVATKTISVAGSVTTIAVT
jgi:hypothetical protein